jgi:hypothetical protein
MGRPQKTKVSETSAEVVQAVVTRVAKKLKTFNNATLLENVNKAFQKDVSEDEVNVLIDAVTAWVNSPEAGKYTFAKGTYTAVAGKRGRPRKVVAAQAAV